MSKLFSDSFWSGVRQWRATAVVYFFQLCLTVTLGMQVFGVLKASMGHSMEINKLLADYDHTVISDFLKVHGASITPLVGQLRWLLLAWLVFSVFINAGLLFCASSEPGSAKKPVRAFWQGGAEYFFPFLKISLVFLLLALVWTAMILVPIAIFLESSLEYFSSEQYTVWTVLSLVVIYLIGLAVLFLWSVISRLLKINSGASVTSSIQNGWKVWTKNKRGFSGLLTGFLGLQLALLAVYWQMDAFTGMTSPSMILILFVVQQTFVFCRIQLRQMMYAGFNRLTSAKFPKH